MVGLQVMSGVGGLHGSCARPGLSREGRSAGWKVTLPLLQGLLSLPCCRRRTHALLPAATS